MWHRRLRGEPGAEGAPAGQYEKLRLTDAMAATKIDLRVPYGNGAIPQYDACRENRKREVVCDFTASQI